MYESYIRDLSSFLRSKKALQYLVNAVKKDPEGVVNDFLKYANEKAWSYAGQIFGANKKGALGAIAA